jgi:hypothetical protein
VENSGEKNSRTSFGLAEMVKFPFSSVVAVFPVFLSVTLTPETPEPFWDFKFKEMLI